MDLLRIARNFAKSPGDLRGHAAASNLLLMHVADTPNIFPTDVNVAPGLSYSVFILLISRGMGIQMWCSWLWQARQRILRFSLRLSSRSLLIWWTSTLISDLHDSHIFSRPYVSNAIARARSP